MNNFETDKTSLLIAWCMVAVLLFMLLGVVVLGLATNEKLKDNQKNDFSFPISNNL